MDTIPLAVSFYVNGINFRASAEQLAEGLELDDEKRPTQLTCIPMYLLASYAAELFLKSALLKRGLSEKDLKQFSLRHNLNALMGKLLELGVPVTSEAHSVVLGLSEQHETHDLRYSVLLDNGKKTYLPPVDLLFRTLDELFSLTRLSTHGV